MIHDDTVCDLDLIFDLTVITDYRPFDSNSFAQSGTFTDQTVCTRLNKMTIRGFRILATASLIKVVLVMDASNHDLIKAIRNHFNDSI